MTVTEYVSVNAACAFVDPFGCIWVVDVDQDVDQDGQIRAADVGQVE